MQPIRQRQGLHQSLNSCSSRRSDIDIFHKVRSSVAKAPASYCRHASVGQALRIATQLLERMKSDSAVIATTSPSWKRRTMLLGEKLVSIFAAHSNHLPQALVNKHVLAPFAWPLAKCAEVCNALLCSRSPCNHSISGEHLQRSVQAEFAIIKINAIGGILAVDQQTTKPDWKKNCIWIYLHCPSVETEAAVLVDSIPDCKEDVCVQSSSKLPTNRTFEIALHYRGVHTWSHFRDAVAVHCRLFTSKNTDMPSVLQVYQALLVAPETHDRETEERPWVWLCRHRC